MPVVMVDRGGWWWMVVVMVVEVMDVWCSVSEVLGT